MASKYVNNGLGNFVHFSAPASDDRLKDVARKELGETEELKEDSLQQLRALIQDHNVACSTTDDFLLRFLRTKKFNVMRSLEAIEKYSCQRAALQNCVLKLQPETLKTVLRHNTMGFLPYRDEEDRLIGFYRCGIWKPSLCSGEEQVAIAFLLSNYAAEEKSSQTTGVVCIIDFEFFVGFKYMSDSMRLIKFLSGFLSNCLPVRFQEIHFVNEPLLIKHFVRFINPLIPKKIKERMLFHGSSTDVLFQHIAPTILPDDFGGNLGPMNNNHLIEIMIDYLKKIKEEQHYFLEQKNS